MMKLIPAHVDRHAVDCDGEIGAVIEIEAAQEGPIGVSPPLWRVTISQVRLRAILPGRDTGLAVFRSARV